MGVKVVNNIPAHIRAHKRRMASDQNGKRDAQIHFAIARCPVDEGRLVDTIRADGDATPQKPVAVAKVGGLVVDGKLVDYAEAVNNGHATAAGHVPANPFWTEAEEVGRNW